MSRAPRLAAAALAPWLLAAGPIGPGAYCPLPVANEKPRCLEPAQAEFSGFFGAVESGTLDDAEAERVERAVVEADANSYLALSSLSYGYFRLAQQLSASDGQDPVIAARLERWNALLARAYADHGDDPGYREAVHAAALDLRERAPAVQLRCLDAEGRETSCDTTESVLRGIDDASNRVGYTGALERLVRRIFGEGP